MYIDIHSHQLKKNNVGYKVVLALDVPSPPLLGTIFQYHKESVLISLGVHPWSASDWSLKELGSLEAIFRDKRVLMVGEIGLDKVSSVPFSTQLIIFNAQIELAEKANKPVILHIVHAMAEILETKKLHKNIPAWIVHGFRGGKQEAEQYLSKGFYLSFGPGFKEEGLAACPIDRLFLETDDGENDVSVVYQKVAEVLHYPLTMLEKQIESNFSLLFNK